MTQSDLDLKQEEVKVLKQLCLSVSEGLITQPGELHNSWQHWLISIANHEKRKPEMYNR